MELFWDLPVFLSFGIVFFLQEIEFISRAVWRSMPFQFKISTRNWQKPPIKQSPPIEIMQPTIQPLIHTSRDRQVKLLCLSDDLSIGLSVCLAGWLVCSNIDRFLFEEFIRSGFLDGLVGSYRDDIHTYIHTCMIIMITTIIIIIIINSILKLILILFGYFLTKKNIIIIIIIIFKTDPSYKDMCLKIWNKEKVVGSFFYSQNVVLNVYHCLILTWIVFNR